MLWYFIWCLAVIIPAVNVAYSSHSIIVAIGCGFLFGFIAYLIVNTLKEIVVLYLEEHGYIISDPEKEVYELCPLREGSSAYIGIMVDEDDEPYAYKFRYNINGKIVIAIIRDSEINVLTTLDKPSVHMTYTYMENKFLNWLLAPGEVFYTFYVPEVEDTDDPDCSSE